MNIGSERVTLQPASSALLSPGVSRDYRAGGDLRYAGEMMLVPAHNGTAMAVESGASGLPAATGTSVGTAVDAHRHRGLDAGVVDLESVVTRLQHNDFVEGRPPVKLE